MLSGVVASQKLYPWKTLKLTLNYWSTYWLCQSINFSLHICLHQLGNLAHIEVEWVGYFQEMLALQLKHWTCVRSQSSPNRPQLPVNIWNPSQSFDIYFLWPGAMTDEHAWCLDLCIWRLFSVYLDVINLTVPILAHLVSWEFVSFSCVSCSCPFLIWLQRTHCAFYSDSHAEKCCNHMKTENWPRESPQMHSDLPVANNTQHRPEKLGKSKGHTSTGNGSKLN